MTHAHVMTVPVFTFVVGVLFLMTGIPQSVKLVLGPLPMLAVLLDISGWWMARYVRTVHLRHRSRRRCTAPRTLCRSSACWDPCGSAGGECRYTDELITRPKDSFRPNVRDSARLQRQAVALLRRQTGR